MGRPLGRIESWWIGVAAYVAYLGIVLLRWTTRMRLIGADDARGRVQRGEPIIVAFWHDQLLGVPLGYGGGPLCSIVSWHRDGEIAMRCLQRLGMRAVRGSSTRGWMGALRGLIGELRAGYPIVIVPDGPRGPRHRAKSGAVQLARATGVEIVPIGFDAGRGMRVGSWDRMLIPWPFSRGVLVQGDAIRVGRDASAAEMEEARARLESELERVSQLANAAVAGEAAGTMGAGGPAPGDARQKRGPGGRARASGGKLLALGYDALMTFVAVAIAGACRLRPRWSANLAQRLGRHPAEVMERIGTRRIIWLHGASVGEVQGIRVLVEPLRRQFPEHAILVSSLTHTGRALAASVAGVDAAVLFPLDARLVVRRALAVGDPDVFIFTETELWPGFLSECARRQIPCVLVSGRVSPRSVRRYAWVRPMMREVLAPVTFCMQSPGDAERIVAIGAQPDRVTVGGSLKAEGMIDEGIRARVATALRRIGVTTRVLIVGASTHEGEEVALLRAFDRIRDRCPEARLLLAPRHPERFQQVGAVLEDAGAAWVRFSDLESRSGVGPPSVRIVLLDRIGVLRACFPLAYLVFVGGTLAAVGGHNLLEPAAEGCAVVFGPHTETVAEVAAALLAAGAARRVSDGQALVSLVESLAPNVALAADMGRRASQAAASQRGALARHLEVISPMLGDRRVARVARRPPGRP